MSISLEHHLATAVMGWELIEHVIDKGTYDYRDKAGNHIMRDSSWDPPNNIKQALLCVATLAGVEPEKLTMANIASVIDIGILQFKPIAEAFSLSCADATKWK